MYVCSALGLQRSDINAYTSIFLSLPQPTPLLKPVSAPSICPGTVDDTALRWLEAKYISHICTMYPYAQNYNIFFYNKGRYVPY